MSIVGPPPPPSLLAGIEYAEPSKVIHWMHLIAYLILYKLTPPPLVFIRKEVGWGCSRGGGNQLSWEVRVGWGLASCHYYLECLLISISGIKLLMTNITLTESVVGVILKYNFWWSYWSNEQQVKDEPSDHPDIVCLVIVRMDGWWTSKPRCNGWSCLSLLDQWRFLLLTVSPSFTETPWLNNVVRAHAYYCYCYCNVCDEW